VCGKGLMAAGHGDGRAGAEKAHDSFKGYESEQAWNSTIKEGETIHVWVKDWEFKCYNMVIIDQI
jgi:hypothetical protein